MNLTCRQCKTKLNIPDHKIPKDKDAKISCPKCKYKITIPASPPAGVTGEMNRQSARLSFEDRMNAMVCVGDPELQKKTGQTLAAMGFEIQAVKDAKTAMSKMEYHVFHLLITDEAFDRNKGAARIIHKLNTVDMSLRRRICAVLLTRMFQTNDNMAALHKSVNNILHAGDIAHLESFLTKALFDHKNLYSVYNESLKSAGKA